MPPMPVRPPPWCRTFSDRYVSRATLAFLWLNERNGDVTSTTLWGFSIESPLNWMYQTKAGVRLAFNLQRDTHPILTASCPP